jgi:histidyl-tRNA synthetase
VAADELAGVLAALDKWERAPEETERLLHVALRADAVRVQPVLEFAAGLRRAGDELRSLPVAAPLNDCLARLDAMGLGPFVELDFTVVRGLAYYTGVVFELFDAARAFRAICGGGRYDTLMRDLAGVDLPCVGFGMGDVVLGELLTERAATPGARPALDAFLVAVTEADVAPLLALAHTLRERGLAVEYGLRAAPVRKQLELAAARGAPRAVIVGPAERAADVAVVRDLATGVEDRVPLTQLRDGRFRP